MTAPFTGDDPLAGYTPDWKKKKPATVAASAVDPLADYRPKPKPAAPSHEGGYGERLATTVLSAAQVIPGMKMFEAAMASGPRSGAKGMPVDRTGQPVEPGISYRDAYKGLEEQTDKLGHTRQFLAKAAASPVLAPIFATRGFSGLSAAKQGMALGAADQALSGDPDATAAGTAGRTVLGGVAGGVAGKGVEIGLTALRSAKVPTLGRQAVDAENAMREADLAGYGKAANEAAAHYASGQQTPNELAQAFQIPEVARYVKMVKRLDRYANADDATVAQEVYKQLSSEQEGLKAQLAREGYKASKALKLERITELKKAMLKGMDKIAPSFRAAVGEHAEAEGEQEAARTLTAGARRAARGGIVPTNKLATQSEEALLQHIERMTRDKAVAGRDAVLGSIKESGGIQPNRVTGKLNVNALGPYTRTQPLLNALDAQVGGAPLPASLQRLASKMQMNPGKLDVAKFLRAMGITTLTPEG